LTLHLTERISLLSRIACSKKGMRCVRCHVNGGTQRYIFSIVWNRTFEIACPTKTPNNRKDKLGQISLSSIVDITSYLARILLVDDSLLQEGYALCKMACQRWNSKIYIFSVVWNRMFEIACPTKTPNNRNDKLGQISLSSTVGITSYLARILLVEDSLLQKGYALCKMSCQRWNSKIYLFEQVNIQVEFIFSSAVS
jgi:hypothetical protein